MRSLMLLPFLVAVPAFAQTAQGDLAVTIYNNNLALVQDVRTLSLPAGRTRQEFPDVSAQIRAETVTLAGAGVAIVEQNFDYDLLSPDKLMEKAVGQAITIVRTNPATGAETREQAVVLAANGGIVLRVGNHIEVLRDDGLPVRVVFDKVPDNLRARPTLSVTLASSQAGPRPITLSYLTSGLGWKADYVVLFDEAKSAIDAQGWVTLSNNSGTTFTAADTLLVAGQPNEQFGRAGNNRFTPRTLLDAGTETGSRERLGDFYLYPLAERTTIANAQQKQVSFLDVKGAAARKAYEFHVGWLATIATPQSAATVLKFSNTAKGGGLGDQLPAGTVRVYIRDARGQPQFIGENQIGHTPLGSVLGIRTGEAFDVKVKAVVEKRERLSSSKWRSTMRYTMTNARAEGVTVDLVQDGLWGDVRIIEQSQPGTRTGADTSEWQVPVPANGEAVLTATFETRY